MTFFVPTGSNQAFDTCDILFAISSGPAACNVTFANGVTIRVGASVEDFTNEVNALYPPTAPLMIGPGPTSDGRTGALAARKVQRVQPRNGFPLESLCTMDALGFGFFIPFDVPTVAAFLNATSDCGGGGGSPVPYQEAGTYAPTINTGPGVQAGAVGPWTYSRQGQIANAPDPDIGDQVVIGGRIEAVLTAAILSLTVSGFPAPVDVSSVGLVVQADLDGLTSPSGYEVEWTNEDIVTIKATGIAGSATVILDVVVVYAVAGV